MEAMAIPRNPHNPHNPQNPSDIPIFPVTSIFEDEYGQCMFSYECDRNRNTGDDLQDANSLDTAETPGLVTQTTTESPSSSSNANSPAIEPAEASGQQVVFLNLQESRRLDDNLTYPQVPKEIPPRSPHLSLVGAGAAPATSASGPAVGLPVGSNGNIVRSRRLVDREDTAHVRETGACIRCRTEKTKVGAPVSVKSSSVVDSAKGRPAVLGTPIRNVRKMQQAFQVARPTDVQARDSVSDAAVLD
jgi:hypothetical protein